MDIFLRLKFITGLLILGNVAMFPKPLAQGNEVKSMSKAANSLDFTGELAMSVMDSRRD